MPKHKRQDSKSSASSGGSSSSASSASRVSSRASSRASSQGSLTRAFAGMRQESHMVSGSSGESADFPLEIHGIVVRDTEGEYYVPQKSLFVCGDFEEDRVRINAKNSYFLRKLKKTGIAEHQEFYQFKIDATYPINITKVSGIDRNYSGYKLYKAIKTVKKSKK